MSAAVFTSILLGVSAVTNDEDWFQADAFGVSLAAAGDRDGDGVPDLWVGDPSGPIAGPRAGSVWLVSGGTGEALLEIGTNSGLRLVSARTGALRSMLAKPTSDEWPLAGFMRHVLPARDIDGDGRRDLLVTAPLDLSSAPAAVYSSRSGENMRLVSLEHRPSSLERIPTFVGLAACVVGDVDRDGTDDFALGGASILCGGDCAGTVVVVSGATFTGLKPFTRTGLRR